MKKFMGKNFILSSDTAEKLFHQYAEQMPVIDYHCHINPQEIVDDRVYKNITQAWLEGDHYKWRLMRAIGAPEEEVTGNAPERVKFQRFVEALEHAPGNPLYHWSHMELQRYMGYDGVLSAETAEEVWKLCEEQLKDLSVRKIIKNSKVEVIVTTDDPIADLEAHRKIRAEHLCSAKVLPSWRPDQAMAVERKSFSGYMKSLGEAAGVEIKGLDSLKAALLSSVAADPTGYGRILRDATGNVCGIVEHKDATQAQRNIREVNASVYVFEAKALLGQALGAKYDVAHGASLAAVWGSWARYQYSSAAGRFARFADKVWGIRKEDEKEAALAGIEATEAYFRAIGMPTSLTELGVDPSEEDLRELSLNATMNDTVKLSRLKPLGAEEVLEIYHMAR